MDLALSSQRLFDITSCPTRLLVVDYKDGKERSLFRSGTGSDAAAFLTAIPTAAVTSTSKRTGKALSMYAADNARFRIQCKLRFRHRLL